VNVWFLYGVHSIRAAFTPHVRRYETWKVSEARLEQLAFEVNALADGSFFNGNHSGIFLEKYVEIYHIPGPSQLWVSKTS